MYKLIFIDPSFWKSNARKVFAVDAADYEASRSFSTSTESHPSLMPEDLEALKSGVDEIKNVLRENILVPINLQTTLRTTRLISPLEEAFRCLICLGTASSPVAISICCRQVLGCATCLNLREVVENGRCPHCREDSYSTVSVNTFERVLDTLQDIQN